MAVHRTGIDVIQLNMETKEKETKHDAWQAVMDRAYALWQKNDGWDFETFLESLDEFEARVVVLGKLNQQVLCNGFSGWAVVNGYMEPSMDLLTQTLRELGTPTMMNVLGLIRRAEDAVEAYEEAEEPCPHCGRSDAESAEEELDAEFEELDDIYYGLKAQFEKEVEAWIVKNDPMLGPREIAL